jgi:hypothetical protein
MTSKKENVVVIDLIDSDDDDENDNERESKQSFEECKSITTTTTLKTSKSTNSSYAPTITQKEAQDESVIIVEDDDNEENKDEQQAYFSSRPYVQKGYHGESSQQDDDDRATLPLTSEDWLEYQEETRYSAYSIDNLNNNSMSYQAVETTTKFSSEIENDILRYDWRSKPATSVQTTVNPKKKSDVQNSVSNASSTYQTASTISVSDSPQVQVDRSSSFKSATSMEGAPKRGRKPTAAKKKTGKSEEEKRSIAAALGKHRHLELKIMSSNTFWSSSMGGTLEFYLIENARERNIIKLADVPFPNLVVFRRHRLQLMDDGNVVASNEHYFMERLGILVWTGMEVINDLRNAAGQTARLNMVEKAVTYLEQLHSQCTEPSEKITFLVILLDCDGALAANSSSSSSSQRPVHPRELEDFLVLQLGIRLGVSHCHAKTPSEAAELIYQNFVALEKYPYRKALRATFLDNVKRFKSFSGSASQDSESEKRTNRVIDGSQLSSVWINQLRCFPRMGESVAEAVAMKYPSFRFLYDGLRDNPAEVEGEIQHSRAARRELKLARTVCSFFLSEDPDEKPQ